MRFQLFERCSHTKHEIKTDKQGGQTGNSGGGRRKWRKVEGRGREKVKEDRSWRKVEVGGRKQEEEGRRREK